MAWPEEVQPMKNSTQTKKTLGVLTLCSLMFSGLIAVAALADQGGNGGSGGRGSDGEGSSDETIGGWPMVDDSDIADDGLLVDGRTAPTPVLHIEGPTTAVFNAVLAVTGEGDVIATTVAPNILRLDFVGSFDIALDDSVLSASPALELGIDAQFPNDLRVNIAWDGGHTPLHTIPSGDVFDLSYARLVESGVLEQPIQVNALMGSGHAQISISSGAGIVTLSTN